MSGFVGALHEFHDAEFAQGWANRFVPTPERLQLFDTIIERLIEGPLPSRHIVELGIGPGYLAARLLEKMPDVTYEGIDFSRAMLDIAASRLERFSSRIEYTQADLVKEEWGAKVTRPVGAIVSTWALPPTPRASIRHVEAFFRGAAYS
ncbi:MAG: class I SAM-dependent methyltransferase [Ardenticatenaceae bacterium]